MATFALIHGGFHGAWCWHKVVPLLRKSGHTVIAPDLPGHGIDRTPFGDVSLQSYADCVCKVLDAASEPVILVGHSMGGFVIAQAAELCPQKVKCLVYFASAIIGNGMTFADFMGTTGSQIFPNFIVAEDGLSITLPSTVIREGFYHDCSDADVALAEMCLTPQPTLPLQEPQHTTPQNWGRIPRHYIETLQDHALPLQIQRRSYQQFPCESVVSMNTSHSPFFSAPEKLVEHLLVLTA